MSRQQAESDDGGGHDLTCRDAIALVATYLDQVLSPDERALLEQHLVECPHCREHVAQLEAAILVTGAVSSDEVDPRARHELMELYRRWNGDRHPK